MRRPLCFLCLTFAAILAACSWLLPVLIPSSVPDYNNLDRQQITLEGTVYRKEYRTGGAAQKEGTGGYSADVLIIYLKSVHISNQDLDQVIENQKNPNNNQIQRVICYIDKTEDEEPMLGSSVRISGKVKCFAQAGNPGEFDAHKYYRIMKIDFQLQKAHILAVSGKGNPLTEGLYRLQRYFSGVIDSVYEEKEAAIMKAILLGEKSSLDAGTKELYRQSSILHILSISGLHISLIGMGLYRFLKRVGAPINVSAVLSAVLLLCYGSMTGMSLSAVRAIFMFIIHLAADMAGRTYDTITALALAAVLLLVEQPGYAGHSGFLFSFGAVAALCILEPALWGEDQNNRKKFRRLKKALASSFAVSAATLPVHLMYYYEFPVYSIFLNMLVIPLMVFVMGAGLFCMLTGGLLYLPASIISNIDKGILWFYEKCCLLCAKIPYGIYTGGMPEKWQLAIYIALLIIFAAMGKKQTALWKLVWMAAAFKMLLLHPPPELQVTMLDVGQGDCIHIQSKSGRNYLIDGGSSSKNRVAEYQILPYLKAKGVRNLEAVFVTHSDIDHCSGILTILEEYQESAIRIGTLILPDIDEESKDASYEELESLAEKNKIRVQYMSRGQVITDGELTLSCLHPGAGYRSENANEYSLSLYLSFGRFTALFTGDVEGRGEGELQEQLRIYKGGTLAAEKAVFQDFRPENEVKRLTVLKVAHHGSENSTGTQFLESVSPRLSLISCGRNNSYGHPHKELIERLEDAESKIYVTAKNGAVTVESDGKRCTIKTFK